MTSTIERGQNWSKLLRDSTKKTADMGEGGVKNPEKLPISYMDLKNFVNSWPSSSNFKSFSRSLKQFFLTGGLNNFGNKIPIFASFFHSF